MNILQWKLSLHPVSFLAALVFIGCVSPAGTVNHVVTSASTYTCCRSLSYQTTDFPATHSSTFDGDSLIVRLLADSIPGRCGADLEVPLLIANPTSRDLYIPISHELDGSRLKLYPWRLLYVEKKPVRLARQIQYGDLLERTDGRLTFHRLPAGSEVRLTGVIPGAWLCVPPTDIPPGYLERELDPTYYANYSRTLRDESARYGKHITPVGIRYDVAYTTLDMWNGLPGATERQSADTTYIDIGVPETPGTFLNASQKVAESNLVTLQLVE